MSSFIQILSATLTLEYLFSRCTGSVFRPTELDGLAPMAKLFHFHRWILIRARLITHLVLKTT